MTTQINSEDKVKSTSKASGVVWRKRDNNDTGPYETYEIPANLLISMGIIPTIREKSKDQKPLDIGFTKL